MEERMNVFKELALSVWDFKSYRKFLCNRGGKVFGFSALLLGIYLLLNTVFMAFEAFGAMHVLQNELLAQIPDFVLEDGILTVEEAVEYESAGVYIYINTDTHVSTEELEDILRTHSTVTLMDDVGLVLQSNGERQMLTYEELQEMVGSGRYNQDDLRRFLQQYVPYLYIIVLIVLLFVALGSIGAFYFRVLLVSLIALVIASVMGVKLPYGKIFALSIYTRTVPVLIRLLLNLIGFLTVSGVSIPFFWIIDLVISGVYAGLALDAIRSHMQRQYTPGAGGY